MRAICVLSVLFFLSFGAVVSAQSMPSALIVAFRNDDTVKISSFVTKDNINNCYNGVSLLTNAIRFYGPKCLGLLLKRGADPNLICGSIAPPLMLAAGEGRLDLVKMLLDKGADVNFRYLGTSETLYGQTAITYAEMNKKVDIANYLKSVQKNKRY